MKKLKEIVEVLSQIVALKCPAQDGGPGSGRKGHTSGKPNPNDLTKNHYEFGSPEWLAHAKKIEAAKGTKPRTPDEKRKEEETEYMNPGKRLKYTSAK